MQHAVKTIVGRRQRRHAEARRHGDEVVAHRQDDAREFRPDTLGHLHGVLFSASRKHDGELLAAQAANEIEGAQFAPAGLDTGHQNLVAHRVTEAVVDLLEVVEIEGDQREAGPAPKRRLDRRIRLRAKRPPRERARQAVVHRHQAQFHLAHHDRGQIMEDLDLGLPEGPRPLVKEADGSNLVAVRCNERRACVKADARLAEDKDVGRKPFVSMRVGNDQRPGLLDRQIAERGFTRQLTRHAVRRERFEPLTPLVDERNSRDRNIKNPAGQPGYPIECFLFRSIENVVSSKSREARDFFVVLCHVPAPNSPRTNQIIPS